MSEENQPDSEEAIPENNETADSGFNLGTVIDTAKAVITSPVSFYKSMATGGGLAEPVIFVVVMAVLTAIVAMVYGILGLGMGGVAIGIGAIIFIPIFSVIGSFIGAAILFVIWKLMGSDKNYETAYRCVAYAFAIVPVMAIISFIPYIAGIIQKIWSAFLMYVASTEVHKIKAQTAKIVFGILAVVGILMGIGSEKATRDLSKKTEVWKNVAESIEKDYKEGSIGDAAKKLEGLDEMTPEEAGKQVGELLKGLEKFSKGLEEGAKE